MTGNKTRSTNLAAKVDELISIATPAERVKLASLLLESIPRDVTPMVVNACAGIVDTSGDDIASMLDAEHDMRHRVNQTLSDLVYLEKEVTQVHQTSLELYSDDEEEEFDEDDESEDETEDEDESAEDEDDA